MSIIIGPLGTTGSVLGTKMSSILPNEQAELLARTEEILIASMEMAKGTSAKMKANKFALGLVNRKVEGVETSQRALSASIKSTDRRITVARAKVLDATKAHVGALTSLVTFTLATALRTSNPSSAKEKQAKSVYPASSKAETPVMDSRQHGNIGRIAWAASAGQEPDYSFNVLKIDGQPILTCVHNDRDSSGYLDHSLDLFEHLGNREFGSLATDLFGYHGPDAVYFEQLGDGSYGTLGREFIESDAFRGGAEAVGEAFRSTFERIGEGMQRDYP